ncbi:MAG TPA: choice-of-anchor J domain-containing protein [Chitinophagales bacterium]|nr:choice-of-anchor J domain-containing protein [Chitinophagales bacterium]HRK27509.1 choice-of-anchor J domain-containing protein [Chitinophagales bacterium]
MFKLLQSTVFAGLVLGFSLIVSAQPIQNFFDDFSDGDLNGYTLYNLDGLVPDDPELATMADSAWTVRNITAQGFTGGNAAFSVSWYVGDAGPSDDWLITPAIEVQEGIELSWTALAITSSGLYRDRYQVFVANAPTIEAFSLTAPLFDTGDVGELATPTQRSLDLFGYAYQTIYIGFRNYTLPYNPPISQGGNELAIDNISVISQVIPSVPAIQQNLQLAVSPNPVQAGNTAKVSFDTTQPDNYALEVYDMSGKILQRQKMGFQQPGNHQANLDLSQLAAGNYLLKLVSSQQSGTVKFVVQ